MKDKNKCIKWILEGGVDDGACDCPKCKEEYLRRTTKKHHSKVCVNNITITIQQSSDQKINSRNSNIVIVVK